LEDVALAQALDGNVLFPQVAIEGSAARDFRIEILNIVGWRKQSSTVGFVDADILDLYGLRCRLKRKAQDAPMLHSSIGLHPNAANRLTSGGAVICEGQLCRHLLNDGCFLGIIGFARRLWG